MVSTIFALLAGEDVAIVDSLDVTSIVGEGIRVDAITSTEGSEVVDESELVCVGDVTIVEETSPRVRVASEFDDVCASEVDISGGPVEDDTVELTEEVP